MEEEQCAKVSNLFGGAVCTKFKIQAPWAARVQREQKAATNEAQAAPGHPVGAVGGAWPLCSSFCYLGGAFQADDYQVVAGGYCKFTADGHLRPQAFWPYGMYCSCKPALQVEELVGCHWAFNGWLVHTVPEEEVTSKDSLEYQATDEAGDQAWEKLLPS
jgi:hypothetical protein